MTTATATTTPVPRICTHPGDDHCAHDAVGIEIRREARGICHHCVLCGREEVQPYTTVEELRHHGCVYLTLGSRRVILSPWHDGRWKCAVACVGMHNEYYSVSWFRGGSCSREFTSEKAARRAAEKFLTH